MYELSAFIAIHRVVNQVKGHGDMSLSQAKKFVSEYKEPLINSGSKLKGSEVHKNSSQLNDIVYTQENEI